MKLEIARGLFLLAALAVATAALAAWEEPGPVVLSAEQGAGHCPLPRAAKVQVAVKPDQDLLLLMFGLTQGMRPQG
ncbi:hypothetical protein NVV94_21980 [Pseudomonas sp. LS1212]|uniref:hypothetical protein n=1 Tax=Pseudomonas sp. LS1212 TaxID=2972478 RepID=UPI00215C74E3|nr:hypothetical protein [Pseudomonas sp. LS1212]UVJ43208.1 hypothetical protein NVV94_21980 [Pseudomonas sp. LS1212]